AASAYQPLVLLFSSYLCFLLFIVFSFFFQAEDGIRDRNVTGVQTCALPILADTFFVGKINTSATAAVGIVFPLMAIIQAFVFFFGHGSGNYISRQLGAQQLEDAAKMSATGFVSAFIMGLVILGVGFAFTDPLLSI